MKKDSSRQDIKRRDFLRASSLGLAGLGLSPLGQTSSAMAAGGGGSSVGKAKAEACILLWLEGGPSQIDTWDPKPSSGFKPISTNVPGVRISELFPRIAQHMDKLAIIRSMYTEESNHPQGTHYAMTGHRPNPAMKFPSLGSVVAKELGPRHDIPPYMLIPKPWELDFNVSYADSFDGAFLGPQYDPIILSDPSREDFEIPDLRLPRRLSVEDVEDRRTFLEIVDRRYRGKETNAEFLKMDGFLDQALNMLLSPKVRKAFDLSQESAKTKDAYGRTRVGQSTLLARRLVESGCRFALVAGYQHGEWDTHGKTEMDRASNDQTLRDQLAPTLDQTLPALLEDLDQRGLLESTVVIVTGEFGRTPYINAVQGRDHWPACWSMLLGGGGIRGGQIIGGSDDRGAQVAGQMVTIGDLFATIYKALGIDWTKTYMSPLRRPIYIANSIGDKPGQPIPELV